MMVLSTGLLLLHSALITNNISFNFVNNLYSHCIYSNCFANANCIYVMGRKFAFYLRITPAIYSHVTKVYESLFLFSTGIQQHDYEMQSNKAVLSPRNAPCFCSTKVGVQLCWNTGYNLNVARRHLHIKGEYSRLCYSVRTRGSNMIARRSYRTRGITRT